MSGLRAPGSSSNNASGATSKRAGLVRPSSGYFSLNVTAKSGIQSHPDTDSDNGRHSPTDVRNI